LLSFHGIDFQRWCEMTQEARWYHEYAYNEFFKDS
jgi:hypothetical protein